MISLTLPWALAGLVAVPVLLWLHRRRRRPVPALVPSVLFLRGEEASAQAPQRRRLDAEILLALGASVLLALAAAGPVLTSGPRGRTVRVVLDAGPSAQARAPDGTTVAQRQERALEAIRAALRPGDVLDLASAAPPRLLEEARRAVAAARLVVTDRDLPDAAPDVRVVAVGEPAAVNAGLLAVDLLEGPAGRRVFAVVGNDAGEPRRFLVRVEPGGHAAEVAVPARGAASVEVAVGTTDVAGAGRLEVALADPGGALASDDRVVLHVAPLLVRFADPPEGPNAPLRAAVTAALDAVAPGRWREAGEGPVTLHVGPPSGASPGADAVLWLHPLPPGVRAARRAPGDPLEPPPPLVGADLDATGADLLYDPAVAAGPPWPLVRVLSAPPGPLVVVWCPDPTAGAPPPVDHPVWPLFLDNLLVAVRGRAGAGGWRVDGVLDPAVTFLGRDRLPFDPAGLEGVLPDRLPRARALAPWLLAAGAACLGVLWFAPRPRPRRAVG